MLNAPVEMRMNANATTRVQFLLTQIFAVNFAGMYFRHVLPCFHPMPDCVLPRACAVPHNPIQLSMSNGMTIGRTGTGCKNPCHACAVSDTWIPQFLYNSWADSISYLGICLRINLLYDQLLMHLVCRQAEEDSFSRICILCIRTVELIYEPFD